MCTLHTFKRITDENEVSYKCLTDLNGDDVKFSLFPIFDKSLLLSSGVGAGDAAAFPSIFWQNRLDYGSFGQI